jgi:hypothetical protein
MINQKATLFFNSHPTSFQVHHSSLCGVLKEGLPAEGIVGGFVHRAEPTKTIGLFHYSSYVEGGSII